VGEICGPDEPDVNSTCPVLWEAPLERGAPTRSLQSVRIMLGHVSISTTAVYLGTAALALVAEYRRCLEQSPIGGAR
jgi:hypothetical protein